MAAAQFLLPKQWEDWCNWLLGIWLCISPWALRFNLDPTATRTAVIIGILVILTEVVTLSVYRAWEEWANILLGLWLVMCPWILAISHSSLSSRANEVWLRSGPESSIPMRSMPWHRAHAIE